MESKDSFFNWRSRTPNTKIIEFVDSNDFTSRLATAPNEISNFNFLSKTLDSFEINKLKNKFKKVTFRNAAFNKSTFKNITFDKCTFEDCFFIATKFEDCEFHHCSFINCNTWKFSIEKTYVNPNNFEKSIVAWKYANIAIATFQELLKNSKREQQPEFIENADFYFRRWKRYYLPRQIKIKEINIFSFIGQYSRSWLYEKTIGYGYRASNFLIFVLIIFSSFTVLNYLNWSSYEFQQNSITIKNTDLLSSAYLTFRNMTAFDLGGFNTLARPAIIQSMIQGIFGFVILGMLISLITKKFVR